jgi:uncharacterized repeat protein (TIGR02543 family)
LHASSNFKSQLKIANVGATAGTVTTVSLPSTNDVITSLTADFFGERFFVTTSSGDIWSISSDGLSKIKVFTGASNTNALRTDVQSVFWGAWYDSYSSNYYFCPWAFGMSTKIYKASVTRTTMTTPVAINDNNLSPITVPNCDGLGIDPATQEVFALASQSSDGWSRITSSGLKTVVTNFKDSSNNDVTRTGNPSSMFVSHTGSKIYFSTETSIYETGFDGSGTRVLYTEPARDFQNIAVYYGATAATIVPLSTNTVIFDLNNGSGTMLNDVNYVAAPLSSNAFSRTGYVFTGWNTAANGNGTAYADSASFDFSAGGTTLYAQWQLAPRTVSFNANGGSGSMTPQSSTTTQTLTSNSLTKTGYSFAGWATSQTLANAGTVAYADAASYNFITSGTRTLWAVWTAVPAAPSTPSVPSNSSASVPAGSISSLAITGINSSFYLASGSLATSLIILGGVMVYARRMQKN